MDGAHIHLLLNHFPIVGGLVALVVLVLGWLRRDDVLFRAGLWLFVAITLLAAATYLSGEPAEHVLEERPGFNEEFVEPHEDAALWALILYGVLGVGALFTALRYARRAIPRALTTGLLVWSVLSVAAAARVGWLGGKISHEELRGGSPDAVEVDGGVPGQDD